MVKITRPWRNSLKFISRPWRKNCSPRKDPEIRFSQGNGRDSIRDASTRREIRVSRNAISDALDPFRRTGTIRCQGAIS